MRALIGSALALLTAACASASPPAPAPAPAPTATAAGAPSSPSPAAASNTGLRIPARVASFRLGGRHDYEDRALGVQLRYIAPDSVYADVYLYPGPDFGTRCDSVCAAREFTRELAQFQADFPELLNRKYYDSIAVTAVDTLTPRPDRPWRLGQHLQLAVTREGKPARSDFYLFYLPRYRVKVRLTYDPTPARTQATDTFIGALLPQLVTAPPAPPPG